jgi:phage-related protein
MMNWGKDMIQGMINGIKNMIGAVKNAVGNVANTIKSFLHFSRPDEGPLREYESWMPDMVDGLVSTLDKASPRLYKASKELASDIKAGMNLDDIDVGYNANGSIKSNINSNSYDNMVVAFQQALSSMKIELDDEVAGKFVKKTVEDAIYV